MALYFGADVLKSISANVFPHRFARSLFDGIHAFLVFLHGAFRLFFGVADLPGDLVADFSVLFVAFLVHDLLTDLLIFTLLVHNSLTFLSIHRLTVFTGDCLAVIDLDGVADVFLDFFTDFIVHCVADFGVDVFTVVTLNGCADIAVDIFTDSVVDVSADFSWLMNAFLHFDDVAHHCCLLTAGGVNVGALAADHWEAGSDLFADFLRNGDVVLCGDLLADLIGNILADLLLNFEAFLHRDFGAFLLLDSAADLLWDSLALLVLHFLAVLLRDLLANFLLSWVADFPWVRRANFAWDLLTLGDLLAHFVLYVVADLLRNRLTDFLILRAAVLLLGNNFALLARDWSTFLLCNLFTLLHVDRVADLLWLVFTLLYFGAIPLWRIGIGNADLDVIAHLLVWTESELFVDAFVTGFAFSALLVWASEQGSCMKPLRHAQENKGHEELVCAHSLKVFSSSSRGCL